ncbi:MAG: PH domain-containing protein [Eggerthellaceae bacterium]|nr:PH domain-containing protein [Eggerthellaceae bacterium]
MWLGGLRIALSFAVILLAYGYSALMNGINATRYSGAGNDVLVGVGFLLVVFIFVGLAFLFQYVSYKHLWYEMGAEEFSLYSGIFNKKHVHVPYQRVQSVNQRASLTQRIFGVCTVHIDTAGGAANKAVIVPYLRNTDAEWMRTELFARKQALMGVARGASVATGQAPIAPMQPAQGFPAAAMPPYPGAVTGQPQTPPPFHPQGVYPGNVLDIPSEIMTDVRGVFGGMAYDTGTVRYSYGLTNKELLFTGLSNDTGFLLIVLAALSSITGIAGKVAESGFSNQAQSIYEKGASFVMNSIINNTIPAVVVSVIVSILAIWVITVLGTLITFGGFKACRRENRIEVEYGLLQRRFNGVDIDRVQSVVIKQSFIRRLIGYCEISLGKIDAQVDTNKKNKQTGLNPKGLIVHPFVKLDKVPEILAGLAPELADLPREVHRLPKKALFRSLRRRCVLYGKGFWLAVIVAIVQVSLNLALPSSDVSASSTLQMVNTTALVAYLLCVLIAAVEAASAVLWYRNSSFAYDKNSMLISNGGFSRESTSFPRKKIQFGTMKTNPFQRHAKVATISVRTAAGLGGTTVRLLDANEADAQAWLDWLIPRTANNQPRGD